MVGGAKAAAAAVGPRAAVERDVERMVEAVEMVQVEKARVVVVPVAEGASALAMVNHEELEEED